LNRFSGSCGCPPAPFPAKLATGASVLHDRGSAGRLRQQKSDDRLDQLERHIADVGGRAEWRRRKLGRKYAKNPTDKATAMSYAQLLQMNGRQEQSLAVMRKLAIALPKDRQVLAAYGKSLASWAVRAGARRGPPGADARISGLEALFSAEAAILDQLGQKDEARSLYRKALDLKPDEPSILSNLGMSYLLEGDLRNRRVAHAQGRRHARR
jgi:Flp pilus assembly protein TadD